MAKANPKLLEDLRAKLGVSRATLYRRVSERRRELRCDTPEALHSIAFDQGFDLTNYLSPEELRALRPFVSHSRPSLTPPDSAAQLPLRRPSSTPKPALVSIAGVDVERLPGMSARSAQEAKTMAEKVYPLLTSSRIPPAG
jgi:hypothetical protein